MQQYLWLLLTMNKKAIMKQKNHGCPILNRNLYRHIKSFENYCGVIYSPGSEAFIVLHVLYHDETTGHVRCSAAFLNEEPQSSMRWDLGFLIHAKEWRNLKKFGFTCRCCYSASLLCARDPHVTHTRDLSVPDADPVAALRAASCL